MILPVIPVSYLAQQESHHSEHHFPIFSMALAIGPRLKNSDALLTDTRDVGVACPVTWNWWMRRMEGLEAKQQPYKTGTIWLSHDIPFIYLGDPLSGMPQCTSILWLGHS